MFTGALLAAGSAAPGGQVWRPLLLFGLVAVLMGLIVLAQMTDPRRRSRGETDLGAKPPASDATATPQESDPRPAAGGPATGPDER